MEPVAPSRLTVAVAIAAIVAAIGMLVAGVLLAPSGDGHADEASLAATGAAPAHDHADDADHDDVASAAPHDDGDGHEHDAAPTAAGSPGTTAAHEHDDATAAAAASGDHHDTDDVEHAVEHAVEHVAEHAHDVAATAPAAPGAPATPTTVHDHSTPVTTPRETTTAAPTGPIVTIDDARLTAAQQDAAQSLLDRTRAAMASFPDEAAVLAAGYVSIGDGITGFEHFVQVAYLTDGVVLDPSRIESIVLKVSGGTKTVESAMYILEDGSTMADVPEIAGELTTWHDHQNLCWDGVRVVAVTRRDGSCPRGVFRPTSPMLHVWLTDQPCGPFSGIEGTHGDSCSTHHH